MFKHQLGLDIQTKVTRLRGIITARSENLYGCNRYYIQPATDKDNKIPDGWWVDEDDIDFISNGVYNPPKNTGGPMSKVC